MMSTLVISTAWFHFPLYFLFCLLQCCGTFCLSFPSCVYPSLSFSLSGTITTNLWSSQTSYHNRCMLRRYDVQSRQWPCEIANSTACLAIADHKYDPLPNADRMCMGVTIMSIVSFCRNTILCSVMITTINTIPGIWGGYMQGIAPPYWMRRSCFTRWFPKERLFGGTVQPFQVLFSFLSICVEVMDFFFHHKKELLIKTMSYREYSHYQEFYLLQYRGFSKKCTSYTMTPCNLTYFYEP